MSVLRPPFGPTSGTDTLANETGVGKQDLAWILLNPRSLSDYARPQAEERVLAETSSPFNSERCSPTFWRSVTERPFLLLFS